MLTLFDVKVEGSSLIAARSEPKIPLVSNGYHRLIELVNGHWRYVGCRSDYTGGHKVIISDDMVWSVE